MRQFLEALTEQKASVLTVGVILVTMVMGFASLTGAIKGLHDRIEKLERGNDGDVGAGDGS